MRPTTLKLVSLSLAGFDPVWGEGNDSPPLSLCDMLERAADYSNLYSLGWMELQTIMAKIVFRYDLELVDETLDWQRDSRMHTLWEKPPLMVKVIARKE